MLLLALIVFLSGLLLLWLATRQRQKSGIPGGRLIYVDTSRWGPVEKPLYSSELGLTGKPDYLVEQGGRIIPVEVKSMRIDQSPYDSHIYQIAAYCMLVERTLGKKPAYGILHYPNRTFAIDFVPGLERAVLEILSQMQDESRRKEISRSHESPARCAKCGFRTLCDQKL